MKALLVLFALLLFIPGCQKEDNILNSTGDQLDKKVVTFSGSAEGLTNFPYGEQNPFRRFVGEGQSTLGEVELFIDYIMTSLNPTTGTGTSGFGNGEVISQNGSKMYAINGHGTFAIVGTTVTFEATADLAGGTGDFDNIMGTLSYSGTIDQTNRFTQVEWTGSFTRNRPISGSANGENVTVTGSCAANFVRRHIEGQGNASHFGKITAVVEHCINLQTGILMDGVSSLEASNGDKIFLTHNGYGLPVPGTNTAAVNMFCTITGGNGKFENAAGFIWLKGIQVMPEGATTCTFDGVIDY